MSKRIEKHELIAENFTFECEIEIFESDILLPTNSTLYVKVNSDDFIASTTLDIDIKMFSSFANDLLSVYNSLKGSAIIKEAYSNNFIEFTAKSNGHIYVKGKLNNLCRNGYTQELSFENEFDQTYLKKFANDIYAECKKYLKG